MSLNLESLEVIFKPYYEKIRENILLQCKDNPLKNLFIPSVAPIVEPPILDARNIHVLVRKLCEENYTNTLEQISKHISSIEVNYTAEILINRAIYSTEDIMFFTQFCLDLDRMYRMDGKTLCDFKHYLKLKAEAEWNTTLASFDKEFDPNDALLDFNESIVVWELAEKMRRNIRLGVFVGELFNIGLLHPKLLDQSLFSLLKCPCYESLELFCIIFKTVGVQLESSSLDFKLTRIQLNAYVESLSMETHKWPTLQTMFKTLHTLTSNGWKMELKEEKEEGNNNLLTNSHIAYLETKISFQNLTIGILSDDVHVWKHHPHLCPEYSIQRQDKRVALHEWLFNLRVKKVVTMSEEDEKLLSQLSPLAFEVFVHWIYTDQFDFCEIKNKSLDETLYALIDIYEITLKLCEGKDQVRLYWLHKIYHLLLTVEDGKRLLSIIEYIIPNEDNDLHTLVAHFYKMFMESPSYIPGDFFKSLLSLNSQGVLRLLQHYKEMDTSMFKVPVLTPPSTLPFDMVRYLEKDREYATVSLFKKGNTHTPQFVYIASLVWSQCEFLRPFLTNESIDISHLNVSLESMDRVILYYHSHDTRQLESFNWNLSELIELRKLISQNKKSNEDMAPVDQNALLFMQTSIKNMSQEFNQCEQWIRNFFSDIKPEDLENQVSQLKSELELDVIMVLLSTLEKHREEMSVFLEHLLDYLKSEILI